MNRSIGVLLMRLSNTMMFLARVLTPSINVEVQIRNGSLSSLNSLTMC